MAPRLESKVIVVTGGSSGIGSAVAARGASEAIDDAGRRADLDQNLTGVVYSLKHQIPAILASGGGGAIVNNAAVAGVAGVAAMAPYVAAEHGVIGLTRAAALECAGQGVRVNALVTGPADTPLFRRLPGAPRAGALESAAQNPAGRIALPDEIAAFVAFLLSDESAFIAGAALAIDGGFTAQ